MAMNLDLILDKLNARRKQDPSAKGYQELLELCSCALGEAMRLQRESGGEAKDTIRAEVSKTFKQMTLEEIEKEMIFSEGVIKNYEDLLEILTRIVQGSVEAMSLADPVQQAGRVRWLLNEEGYL